MLAEKAIFVMPNTHRRRNSTVASVVCTQLFATSRRQSRRVWTNLPTAKSSWVVSAVWTNPSQSWPGLQYFLCCWAIEVGVKWRHNDVIVEKFTNIDQSPCRQTAMFSFQIVDRIRLQSSWAIVANCVHSVASAVCIGLKTVKCTDVAETGRKMMAFLSPWELEVNWFYVQEEPNGENRELLDWIRTIEQQVFLAF